VPGLALLYGVHLLATAVWVGTLVGLTAFGLPGTAADWPRLWQQQKRVDMALWAGLAGLWATGMFQMDASARYEGFLRVNSLWAAALLTKHILVLAVMALTAWHSLRLLPALRRRAWQARRGTTADPAADAALQRGLRRWAWAQLGLAIAVLLVTAVVRAAA